MTYSASEIAQILAQYSENQFSLLQFAKDQGIADFTLRKWLKGDLPSGKPRGIKKPRDAAMEKEIAEWIKSERADGTPVSRKDIKMEVEKRAKVREDEAFKASSGWLAGFMRRCNFSLQTGTKEGRKIVFNDNDKVSTMPFIRTKAATDTICLTLLTDRRGSISGQLDRVQSPQRISNGSFYQHGPN